MTRKEKIKKYIAYLRISMKKFTELNDLKNENWTLKDRLFIEKIQATDGFFNARVRPYEEPTNYGDTDPCIVTIYRHGYVDWMSDIVINTGTEEDVKDFPCPDHKEGCICKSGRPCKFRENRNRQLNLQNNLIPNAQKSYDLAVAKRKAAWDRIFNEKQI